MAGRKSTATMELAIGATIIAGILILIVMLMAWGNSSSFLGKQYRVVVNMDNVGGLKEGAPVKMGGFQIGKVTSIQFRPGSTEMEIVLDIDDNRFIPKGSKAKVSTAGLVGDAFMEIVPSKSAESIHKATTIADAERLESSPLPDMGEIFVKFNEIGEQITILAANLNDVVGDAQFRKSVKSAMVNIDAVSYQANLILQRGQNLIDNLDTASQNISSLTETAKKSVEDVTQDIERFTNAAVEVADSAKETVRLANVTIENIDGGVSDAREAIKNTLGNPEFVADLTGSVGNINKFTGALANNSESIDELVANLNVMIADTSKIAAHLKEITGQVEPKSVADALNALSGAITSMTEVVEEIKAEPVLALSLNKAADRIVKIKFDEMGKHNIKSADDVLREINRWVRENMQRGYFTDPSYQYETRPYVMPGTTPPPAPAGSRRPYIVER